MAKLVVPFKTTPRVIEGVIDALGLERPTLLLVLAPGAVDEGGWLAPAPEVEANDIPHLRGVVTHIVPVGPGGECEDVILRTGDWVILDEVAPFALILAASRLADPLMHDSRPGVCVRAGGKIIVTPPTITPSAAVAALEKGSVEE